VSRETRLYLQDIADRALRISRLAAGRTFDDFREDDALHEAVLRHLTIIGEAVKSLPPDVRSRAPGVEWREIARLRDLLVHVYFTVKDEIIWQIVNEDVAPLREAVERILADMISTELDT
jgi:uncharacterized protein with HEPN domain